MLASALADLAPHAQTACRYHGARRPGSPRSRRRNEEGRARCSSGAAQEDLIDYEDDEVVAPAANGAAAAPAATGKDQKGSYVGVHRCPGAELAYFRTVD